MRALRVVVIAAAVVVVAACSGGSSKAKPATAVATTVEPSTTTRAPTTTTTISKKQQRENDETAIRHVVEYVNSAYRDSVAEGINALVSSNYDVLVGHYTPEQCVTFWSADNRDRLAIDDVIRPASIQPAPGWVDNASSEKTVPKGRVYSLTVDETSRDVPTGQQVTDTVTIHATVLRDGNAKLFWQCGL